MKILKIMTLVLALALVFASCGSKEEPAPEVEEPPAVETPVVETPDPDPVEPEEQAEIAEPVLNQYPDLDFDGVILERNAILPGMAFKVHYTVTNNGDKTLQYVQGSGSAVVPDALKIVSADIQAVPAVEHLGPMTMDYRVSELEPGSSLEFVQSFIAIEPTDDFVQKAMDYLAETGEYIGDKNIDVISESVDGVTPVEAGQYAIDAVFEYSVLEEGQDVLAMDGATGFSSVSVGVSIG